MRKIKSPNEARKIKDERDALYYGAGIPSVAWSTPRAKPKFSPVMGEEDDPEIKVGVQIQDEWFKQMLTGDMFHDPYLVYLASIDSDDLACRYAYEVMKQALTIDLRVQITNAARIDKEEINEESVFMLHNVFKEANPYRIQCVRDWITVHDDCFRIVVITGMDPYTFSKMVHVNPHAMFLLENSGKVRSSTPKKISR